MEWHQGLECYVLELMSSCVVNFGGIPNVLCNLGVYTIRLLLYQAESIVEHSSRSVVPKGIIEPATLAESSRRLGPAFRLDETISCICQQMSPVTLFCGGLLRQLNECLRYLNKCRSAWVS